MPNSPPLLPSSLDAAGYAAAFDDSRETLDRLATYAERLRQWQRTINLVAPASLDAVWHRHFADSAQLLNLAPSGARLLRQPPLSSPRQGMIGPWSANGSRSPSRPRYRPR